PKNLTFHSDRGKQYTSGAFIQLLQANGVKQSFSATSHPHDNAVAETFFGTFKKEEAYRREYTSEQSFRKSVEQYIQFYNEVRPHQTLKYQTPQAFEDKHYAKFIENRCSNDVME
ncbi:MAG: integrase core domain-containing protein, partial [Clostridiales bacterium]|nr:integrase core domain-containing protein [Clostridiales bacterium]